MVAGVQSGRLTSTRSDPLTDTVWPREVESRHMMRSRSRAGALLTYQSEGMRTETNQEVLKDFHLSRVMCIRLPPPHDVKCNLKTAANREQGGAVISFEFLWFSHQLSAPLCVDCVERQPASLLSGNVGFYLVQ